MLGAEIGAGFAAGAASPPSRRSLLPLSPAGPAAGGSGATQDSCATNAGTVPAAAQEGCRPVQSTACRVGSRGRPGTHKVHATFLFPLCFGCREAASQDSQLHGEALTSHPQQPPGHHPGHQQSSQCLCSPWLFLVSDTITLTRKSPVLLTGPLSPGSISG